MYYTISEVSKKLNISSHTLRFYAKEGLLPFVERNENGVRLFKEEDFEWLLVIECLKKTGMTIKEIAQFIEWVMEGDTTILKRLEMFRERQEAVERQIKELQETQKVLKYKCWFYEKAKEVDTTDIKYTMKTEEMPEDIRILKQQIDKKYK